jgi:hypothetical protein
MRNDGVHQSVVLAAALVVLALVLGPAVALGCTCFGLRSPEEEFAAAGAVFRGKVRSINSDPSSFLRRVQFEQVTPWKGATQSELEVVTNAFSDACGFKFEEGKEYLVYTEPNRDPAGGSAVLVVESCSRTSLIKHAGKDLAFLRRYRPLHGHAQPSLVRPGAATCSATGQYPWVMPVLWLGLLGLLRWRHRQPPRR